MRRKEILEVLPQSERGQMLKGKESFKTLLMYFKSKRWANAGGMGIAKVERLKVFKRKQIL